MPGSGPYSSHLGVAGPQKTSVVISFSMLGVHGSLAALVGEGGSAPPATEWAWLWNSGVQHWQETSPRIKTMPSKPDLIKTMGRFSLSELLTLLASLSFSSELGTGRKGLTYCAPAGTWCTNWRPWERVKKESNVGEENKSQRFWGSGQRRNGAFLGPCLFFNLVVYSLDCAVWWVFIGGQVAFNIKRL